MDLRSRRTLESIASSARTLKGGLLSSNSADSFDWVPERLVLSKAGPFPYKLQPVFIGVYSYLPDNPDDKTIHTHLSTITETSDEELVDAYVVVDRDEVPGHDVWYVWPLGPMLEAFDPEEKDARRFWQWIVPAFMSGFMTSRLMPISSADHSDRVYETGNLFQNFEWNAESVRALSVSDPDAKGD